ncbi:hypothetical protein JCM3770_001132 [Rhodotorula araucariae]
MRVRKPKHHLSSVSPEHGSGQAAQQDAAQGLSLLSQSVSRSPLVQLFAMERETSRARPSSYLSSDKGASDTLDSVLSLVRNLAEQPMPSRGGHPSGPFLSPGGGRAELHYTSAYAFSDLTFAVADEHVATHPADVAFRQVSDDPLLPAFFVQTPSLMYGTAAPAGRQLFEAACAALAPDAPQRLIEIFLHQTQPAMPVLDLHFFPSSDPAQVARAGISYGLLTSMLAHSTCYVHEIRPAHKHLWKQVLLSLEDEYRKPTLQTLQQAIITISSRPAINLAQNHIAAARLTGAAQLLGLHLDPAQWRIPHSERVLRKRLWWAILITDKWRALWYGRPSNISRDSWNVSLPTLDDLDTDPDSLSGLSFIAWCKLTCIVDTVLSEFFSVRALASPYSSAVRLGLLEKLGIEVAMLERDLPLALRSFPVGEPQASEPAPSGVRSFQLCKLGLEMTLFRLTASSVDKPSPQQLISTSRTALSLVQTLVEFLENLTTADFGVFWAPYCSFIISMAGALLIRTALTASSLEPTTRTTCGVFFTRLVVTLTSSHHAARWDVASLALDRIATLLHSLDGQLPELVPLLQLFGPPNHANHGPPIPGPTVPPEPAPLPTASSASVLATIAPPTLLLSPPGAAPPLARAVPPALPQPALSPTEQSSPALDAFWWMQTEILTLPDHLGAVPDIFEGWPGPACDDGVPAASAAAGVGLPAAEGMLFDLRTFLEGPLVATPPGRGSNAGARQEVCDT